MFMFQHVEIRSFQLKPSDLQFHELYLQILAVEFDMVRSADSSLSMGHPLLSVENLLSQCFDFDM